MDKPRLDQQRVGPHPSWEYKGVHNHPKLFEMNSLVGLDDLCKKYINKETVVLELGSHQGVSTSLFCYYAKYVVAVDTWYSPGIQKLESKANNFLFRQGDISVILPIIKSKPNIRFDFIYIDADHQYTNVRRDIKLSMPLLKEGGIIGGHDFCDYLNPGVRKAVRERWSDNEIEVFKDTSWVIKGEKAK
tara:strand:+ start:6873 stop:7439 length:567 start_codon:yes stop_codon:yes gene_type:complete